MKKHTKIYMKAFGYEIGDQIPCEFSPEFSGVTVDDVHHINSRGMGGDPKGVKDCIENLMGVSRHYHDRCEGKFRPISKEDQIETHFNFLRKHGIKFNENWHNEHT